MNTHTAPLTQPILFTLRGNLLRMWRERLEAAERKLAYCQQLGDLKRAQACHSEAICAG